MSERNRLLASIATTISDYRRGEIPAPNPGHVDCWVCQFDEEVQLSILREMDHVLRKTYISKQRARKFLTLLVQHKRLVDDNPCAFWKSVHFLDIQQGGASQKDMLALFSIVLEKECGFGVASCGSSLREFVYLDDGVFTGGRVRQDLEKWIVECAPTLAKVHIFTMAQAKGAWYTKDKIKERAEQAGKRIDFQWWPEMSIQIEDRLAYKNTSDVLWPTAIPSHLAVMEYVNELKDMPILRQAINPGSKVFFTGEKGRSVLEQEFLKSGAHIRKSFRELYGRQDPNMRPLGKIGFENRLGFGSLIVTHRNCPNNAPLVLWADNNWYPLFPRKTNKDTQHSNIF